MSTTRYNLGQKPPTGWRRWPPARRRFLESERFSHFKRESRIAYLGFTYRFGQNQDSRQKKDAVEGTDGGFE